MEKMFTIYANRIEEMEKTFAKYAAKAQKIGMKTSIKIGEPYPKKVTVWENDDINHVTIKSGEIVVEVADVIIDFPTYKLGEYSVAAVVEHGENGNMVYPYGENKIPSRYFKGQGTCEHCRTNHYRVKTILLKDKHGELKQVGTSCVAEYTGITDWDIVKSFVALESLMTSCDIETGCYTGKVGNYYETEEYLTCCIHLIHTKGYNKSNKSEAHGVKSTEITEADKEAARKVIDYFTEREFTDSFLNNVKVAVTNEYCKAESGFIAYAYEAYRKEIAKAERKAQNAQIEYYGNIGDKIEVEVTGKVVGSYEQSFSYYSCETVLIYEFRDSANHVFIWKSASNFKLDENGQFKGKIKGTIKAHNEYNRTKQTILTRVKAVA